MCRTKKKAMEFANYFTNFTALNVDLNKLTDNYPIFLHRKTLISISKILN